MLTVGNHHLLSDAENKEKAFRLLYDTYYLPLCCPYTAEAYEC